MSFDLVALIWSGMLGWVESVREERLRAPLQGFGSGDKAGLLANPYENDIVFTWLVHPQHGTAILGIDSSFQGRRRVSLELT